MDHVRGLEQLGVADDQIVDAARAGVEERRRGLAGEQGQDLDDERTTGVLRELAERGEGRVDPARFAGRVAGRRVERAVQDADEHLGDLGHPQCANETEQHARDLDGAARQEALRRSHQLDDITRDEVAADALDAGGEQARTARDALLSGEVDREPSLADRSAGDPAPAADRPLRDGGDLGSGRVAAHGREDGIRMLRSGDAGLDPVEGGQLRRSQLRPHPASARAAGVRADLVQPPRLEHRDRGAAFAVVDAVDIGEQQQLVGPDHHGEAGGDRVVVGAARVRRVVAVHDRDDAPIQRLADHLRDAEHLRGGAQVGVADEDLAGERARDAGDRAVEVHQQRLPNGGG